MKLLFINLLQVLRHIRRHLGQVVLSVVGLVCGLVCFTLSASDLWYQTHYDDFRKDYRHIYRVQYRDPAHPQSYKNYFVDRDRLPDLRDRLPQGSSIGLSSLPISYEVSTDEVKPDPLTTDIKVRYVDTTFVDMMDLNVVAGNVRLLDRVPGYGVLTDSLAITFFGTDQAVGKTFQVRGLGRVTTYTVAAVVRKEKHTSVNFDYLLSGEELVEAGQWLNLNELFVKTDQPETVMRQMAIVDSLHNSAPDLWAPKYCCMKPLRTAPLLMRGDTLWQSAFYPVSFLLLSVLLLFSAMFNHTALFISMFQEQLHTYRLRQCLGGGFGDNARRLVMELLIIVLAVWLAGAVVLELVMPLYGSPVPQGELYVHYALYAVALLVLLLLFLIWPLVHLHRLYRSSLALGTTRRGMRIVLLVVQMAVSVLLLFLVTNGYRQYRYMTRDGLGFEVDRILMVRSLAYNAGGEIAQLISAETAAELRISSPAIEDARFVKNRLFSNGRSMAVKPGGMRKGVEGPNVEVLTLSEGMTELFEMDVRGWDGNRRSGSLQKDEAFASPDLIKQFGLTVDDCTLRIGNDEVRVVGTLYCRIKSFAQPQGPLLFRAEWPNDTPGAFDMYVRYYPGMRDEAIAAIHRKAERLGAKEPWYYVRDYSTEMMVGYEEEQHYLMLFGMLAAVGLCISFFGVLAMVTYELRRSRRTMAVRRIFGAGYRQLCRSYLTAYLLTVAVGTLLVLPLGYIVMHWWLQRYDDQITVGLWPAVLSVAVVTFFTAGLVMMRLYRAMRERPAEVLQGE